MGAAGTVGTHIRKALPQKNSTRSSLSAGKLMYSWWN